MASVVPLKEEKLVDVKIGELPSWILKQDFPPKGFAGASQRGYYRYYNERINVKKASVAGFPWGWQCACFSSCRNTSGYASAAEAARGGGALCMPDHDLCLAPLNPFTS